MTFRVYFYSLKNDDEIYTAQYRTDEGAEANILDIYNDDVSAIWRPERVIYEDLTQLEAARQMDR